MDFFGKRRERTSAGTAPTQVWGMNDNLVDLPTSSPRGQANSRLPAFLFSNREKRDLSGSAQFHSSMRKKDAHNLTRCSSSFAICAFVIICLLVREVWKAHSSFDRVALLADTSPAVEAEPEHEVSPLISPVSYADFRDRSRTMRERISSFVSPEWLPETHAAEGQHTAATTATTGFDLSTPCDAFEALDELMTERVLRRMRVGKALRVVLSRQDSGEEVDEEKHETQSGGNSGDASGGEASTEENREKEKKRRRRRRRRLAEGGGDMQKRVRAAKRKRGHVGRHLLSVNDSSSSPTEPSPLFRIGTVNLHRSDALCLANRVPSAQLEGLPYSPPASNLTWQHMFPKWVYEDGSNWCPALPWPTWAGPGDGTVLWPHSQLYRERVGGSRARNRQERPVEALVVRVPCEGLTAQNASWARNVTRMHLLLLAASAAAAQEHMRYLPVLVLSPCRPPPSLFHCDQLERRGPGWWLYILPTGQTRRRLRDMPVGACGFQPEARPPPALEGPAAPRYAYATLLHGGDRYLCGALVLGASLKASGTRHDLLAMVTPDMGERARRMLQEVGWTLVPVPPLAGEWDKRKNTYCLWNHSKLWAWALRSYSRVVFMDTDHLVLRPLDDLFSLPELTAQMNLLEIWNSGLFVVEPSECTFRLILDALAVFEGYPICDQGLLNELFPWWHRMQSKYGRYTMNPPLDDAIKTRGPGLNAIHYLGMKPWLCYREFDCNWLCPWHKSYIDDDAHHLWWEAHDRLTEEQQSMCLLPGKTKAQIALGMRKLEMDGRDPQIWNRTIEDPRKDKCWSSEDCDWQKHMEGKEPKYYHFVE